LEIEVPAEKREDGKDKRGRQPMKFMAKLSGFLRYSCQRRENIGKQYSKLLNLNCSDLPFGKTNYW